MSTSASTHRLHSHVVRRLPTDNDLAQRQQVTLTRRDQGILCAIYPHGMLTAELIELAFFPGEQDRRSPSSCGYDRLRQLWLWGYVERIDMLYSRRPGLRCWVSESAPRARGVRVHDPRTQRWLPVLPDAGFEMAYPNGRVELTEITEDPLGALYGFKTERYTEVMRALCGRRGASVVGVGLNPARMRPLTRRCPSP